MTDYSDPWWGHISGKCIDDCPWCHINELQAELAALREAVRELYDDSWWHHGTRCVHDDQLTELTALQERGE